MCTLHGKAQSKLTNEERARVEANMNLVYHTVYKLAHKGWVKSYQEEDAIQDGMIGLIKAAMYYEPEKGYEFSTLAVKCIEQCVLLNSQKAHRRRQKYMMISLDEPLPEKFDREGMQREEVLASDEDLEEKTLDGAAEALMRKLEGKNRHKELQTLQMYLRGMKKSEIAAELGESRQCIQQRLIRMRPMLTEIMNSER